LFKGGIGTAKVRIFICKHQDPASQEQHARMGFHDGWGVATDQLVALASTLR
jgi:uncharacterized protein YndB with AHSA1/START domain